MSDIPRRAVTRTAKLAALPVSFAGRAAWGLGMRLGGRPAELIAAEVQARTAEQLFRVLGELKGGAMKFGQALSVLESALPEELAAPYRATLTKLQEAAPPMPAATVHKILAANLGKTWRRKFASFDDVPAAAASIGQVHRAVWKDGREVAVKVQYPGAGPALLSDLKTISRMSGVISPLLPGLDLKPLITELRDRLAEEVDYAQEAESQRAFHDKLGDPDIAVPAVIAVTESVLVSEWMEGTSFATVIESGTQADRDRAGELYVRFLFAGPAKVGLLHADLHPGNFRLLPDGRLGVLDFGAVARLPDGLPTAMGRLMRIAVSGDAHEVHAGLQTEGFLRPGVKVDPVALMEYLGPFTEPAGAERFSFSRDWMREQFSRVSNPREGGFAIGLKLNMPPSYLLIHRVWLGGIGVLCQLGAEVPVRAVLERELPGFADDGEVPGKVSPPTPDQ